MLHLWGLAGLEVLLCQKERFCHQKVMEECCTCKLKDEILSLAYIAGNSVSTWRNFRLFATFFHMQVKFLSHDFLSHINYDYNYMEPILNHSL